MTDKKPTTKTETPTENVQTQEASKALSPLAQSANQVQAYAKKLLNDERAAQFHTQISVMAKRDPKIAQCTGDSLITAMLACIHLDLMPNTPEQLAHVIPYRNNRANRMEAQFQVGYKGLVRLAQRSGEIKSINAELVYKGDDFDVELGTDRKLSHRPDFDVDRTDYKLVTHAYCTVKLTNGETAFEVMTRKELDKIKTAAKAASTDAPWATWPAEMAKKTILKRAMKLLPSSTSDNRLAMAAQFDSLAEASKLITRDGEVIEGTSITEAELKEFQTKKIAAAEEERRQIAEDDFQAKAVEASAQDGVDEPLSDEEAALKADGERLDAEMAAMEAQERDA